METPNPMTPFSFSANDSARRLLLVAIMVAGTTLVPSRSPADTDPPAAVAITSDFPGGNVKVTRNQGSRVHVEPDLRGGRPWFYWCFEATAEKPGRVDFTFPAKVAGFSNGAIGFQGPAISRDQGLTWKWMGTEQVDGSTFSYDFSVEGERVRFAVTIPYVHRDLQALLERNASNPHLMTSVLTTSRHGRQVELLRIGAPGPNVMPVLVTGRHHAAESIASYVLEGFLQEAMSESPSGQAFREKYLLYAVPLVDRDGVEEGDQGKNRRPHDHNRDYGETSIYPEIQAIKQLDREVDFRFALDFHCPTLVMNDHQVMYFVGPKEHPQHNFENVSEFAGWIKKGLPAAAPVGPYVWLKPATTPAPMNSNYFGYQAGTVMAATLEIPFAPPGKQTDPASCRKYGQAILAAWVATHFRAADETSTTVAAEAKDRQTAGAELPMFNFSEPQKAGKFYATFKKWDQEDRGRVVTPDEVLVIGSSSIRGWRSMSDDLSPIRVLQRGFGGSRMQDVLLYQDFFRRYGAKRIVIYEGDNDLGGSSDLDPATFIAQCREFVDFVRKTSPETEFYFISIKPSTARMSKWPRMKQGNQLLQALASADKRIYYVDVASVMLQDDGVLRDGLIGEDGVHMTPAGYARWTEAVRSHLIRAKE